MRDKMVRHGVKNWILPLIILFPLWVAAGSLEDVTAHESGIVVESPSGEVKSSFFVADKKLHYRVQFDDAEVISASPLGITVNKKELGQDVRLRKASGRTVDETYATRGVHSIARNHYREQNIEVTYAPSQKQYVLQVRVYDDGVAFRYLVPGEKVPGEGTKIITAEASSWTLPARSQVWFFERDSDWKLKTYAGEWRKTDVSLLPVVSKHGPVQGPPLVVELPGKQGFAVLTEAALYNYSGMRLRAMGHNRVQVDFTEGTQGFQVENAFTTPWRVTLLGKDLNSLVNSDLISNLNPAPDPELFADLSYIKPGRATWRWWSEGTGSPAEEKQFIDYAHKLGFEYNLIDDGWQQWRNPWQHLEELCAYAGQRQVGLFVWKDWNQISDPAGNWKKTKQFLDKVKSAGAVGVKIDFMNAESRDRIDFEIATLRLAAERKLMVVFHGIHKSTGESRTYPNEVSREGIRGLELNRMNEPLPASHNAALPFTRFIVGHADYTPLGYSRPGATTYAHQLATVALFTSPLQVIAENPEMLLNDPAVAPGLEMLKATPTTWDETRVLEPSRIGELAIFARRSGQEWYLAILNGRNEPVVLPDLDLSFLGNKPFTSIAVFSPTPTTLKNEVVRGVIASKKFIITLAPADGYLIRFIPAAADGHTTHQVSE